MNEGYNLGISCSNKILKDLDERIMKEKVKMLAYGREDSTRK